MKKINALLKAEKRRLFCFLLTLQIVSTASIAQVGPPNGTAFAAGTALAGTTAYTFTQASGTYTAITGGTQYQAGTTLNTDAVSAAVNIGFDFRYNNRSYSSVRISNNGFITFGANPALTTTYTALSTNVNPAPEGVIAGFAANLRASAVVGASPEIRYTTLGSAPNRIFVVQYQDMAILTTGVIQRLNFQIRLSETSNVVAIMYGTAASGATTSTGQVGLKGGESSDIANRTGTNWTTIAAGTAATSTCTLGTTGGTTVPTSGLTFTWTPGATWSTATYAPLPYLNDFATWSNGLNTGDRPGINVRTWPSRGDNSWRSSANLVSGFTSTVGWSSTGGATATFTGAAVAPAARFHDYDVSAGSYGDMDFYVNLIGSSYNTYTINFLYINPSGTDRLSVLYSQDGGLSFTQLGSDIPSAGNAWASVSRQINGSSATGIIRIRAIGSFGNDDILIDNLAITANTSPSDPFITSFSPSTNLDGCGGQTITIVGNNFQLNNISAVKFSGVDSPSFQVINDSTLSAVTPINLQPGSIEIVGPSNTGAISPTTYSIAESQSNLSITISAPQSICLGSSSQINFTGPENATIKYTINDSQTQSIQLNNQGTGNFNIQNNFTNGIIINCVSVNIGTCSYPTSTSSSISSISNEGVNFITSSPSTICPNESSTITVTGAPNSIIHLSINGNQNQSLTLNSVGSSSLVLNNISSTTTIMITSVDNGTCIYSPIQTVSTVINVDSYCNSQTSTSPSFMLVQDVITTSDNSANKTIQVQFKLNWGASWRDNINHDAAWVFIKYKNAQGEWIHAKLNSSGFDAGSGTPKSISVTPDKLGAFISIQGNGSGNFEANNLQLQWNYGIDGLNSVAGIEVRVFAVEMVYAPQGDFNVAKRFNGGNLFAAPGDNFPVVNTRLTPSLTYNDGTAATIRIKGDAGIDSNNDGSVDKPDYPTGYRPFYCYKYELTEQQYADFLNCLTPAQRSNLGVAGAGITLANGEYFSSAPNRACGNMTAQRMLAYADWSGLRPMTILEMNKASYGPLQPFQTETNFFAAGGANSPFYNNNNNTFGPLLDVGFYDSGTTTRSQSGSSYYGIDDLTGNAREQVVSLNFLNFNSVNGDGVLDASGNANVNGWSNTGMLIGYDQFAGANYSAPYIGTRLVRSAE